MTKQSHGFLLLEFTIYFFLLVFMTTLIGTILVSAQQRVDTIAKRGNGTMTQWFAVDRLVHDLNHAPSSVDAWKLLEEGHMVWHQKGHDIGWKCHDNFLERYEGEFDVTKQHWLSHNKVLVAQNITVQCASTFGDEKNIKGILLHITSVVNGLSEKQSRTVACQGCV